MKQCKDKIRSLTDAYKATKIHNDENTGEAPKFSNFYEDFDEIYGTRHVVKVPLLTPGLWMVNVSHKHLLKVKKRHHHSTFQIMRQYLLKKLTKWRIIYRRKGVLTEEKVEDNGAKAKPNVNVTPKQLKKNRKSGKKSKGKSTDGASKSFREKLLELQKQANGSF